MASPGFCGPLGRPAPGVADTRRLPTQEAVKRKSQPTRPFPQCRRLSHGCATLRSNFWDTALADPSGAPPAPSALGATSRAPDAPWSSSVVATGHRSEVLSADRLDDAPDPERSASSGVPPTGDRR